MADNLTFKILRAHLTAGELIPGADICVRPDQILLEDATGTMAAMQFEQLGADSIEVPLAVMYVDHNVLQIDDKNMQDHRYLTTFCQRYGLRYSPAGHGISHYIHLERFTRPGELLLGADSHTSTAGAAAMFATGAGGLEVAVAMAGRGFTFPCPRVIGVELLGALRDAVEPKDVVLELLRRYDVRGGRGAVFEFYGAGVATISTSGRATIANMIIETGATTAVFPSDAETARWLAEQGRDGDFRAMCADSGATYDEEIRIDLTDLRPLVAVPHSPGNVIAVDELPDTPVTQVCVGSSVNSSYEDLATVAAALRGRTVHPRVSLTVTPGSRQILNTIIESGVYQDLLQAGARMLEPICGPCVGIGQAPLQGAASLRTFNRNFPGRSGTAEDQVYLCSPSTAAASALTGRITDPTARGSITLRPAAAPDVSIHDHHITVPLPARERASVIVERGPNLVAPAPPTPVPDGLTARVLIDVGDDVSTGDMAPDGAIAMSVWSNIAICARYMFQRFDAEFHDRARRWGGGIIVGGHNYGQGSSREHAALIPAHLGVKLIAARSYARIHRRNLIAVGIVPLVLPDDTPQIDVGQEWTVTGLRQALSDGREELSVVTGDRTQFSVTIDLTAGERETLLAGGLLAQVGNYDPAIASRGVPA
ncbi:aconitate hydratase [Mycolicibacterium stellerae]|uniref:aconitate hydratase n=1 Tax=Mycolicibacterium stellerae TaxID=2358193 RepID=UPI000F0B82DA|nr:aconitate hydratase [Mycolicibacterium stellerae]